MAIAEETLKAGFAGLKIKSGFATFAEDLVAVRAGKRELGSATALMIDYNQSHALPEAMARGRMPSGLAKQQHFYCS